MIQGVARYTNSMKPRLIIEQKITAFVNKYMVYGTSVDGAKSDLLALAQQKRIALKEKVTFYSDESKSSVSFSFRAEKVLDVHGRYFVEGQSGEQVGVFRKVFGQSLAVSTWRIMDDAGNDVLEIKESNVALAIARRYGGWIPIVGDLIEILTLFLKYHFVFVDIRTGEVVGKYEKTTLFRDHYTLSCTDEVWTTNDWRTLAAMGVALDALQSR